MVTCVAEYFCHSLYVCVGFAESQRKKAYYNILFQRAHFKHHLAHQVLSVWVTRDQEINLILKGALCFKKQSVF